MSEDKKMNVELNEELLERVDGGFDLNDLLHAFDQKPETETLPAGGKTFTIKSTIATGEPVADQTQMQSKEDERTGKRMPKVVFRDKGNSI